MSSVKLLREVIGLSLLVEGPLDKLRNMGMPEPFAEWFYDFLPEYSKNHAHWYAKELAEALHQFKDYLKGYKKAAKRDDKDVALANFEKWKEQISGTVHDVEIIDKWAQESNINISKKKEAKIVIGREIKSVPFDFASAVKAAKQYFDLQDGETFMELGGGWIWLDRQSNYCSIEGKLMGHCGSTDDSDSTMFSLRDPDGLPHVTAEILIEDDGATIKQMKGKGNATPEEKYWPMIFSLLKNPALKLVNYHAVGRHGGDLKWDMISEDVQEQIMEAQKDTWEGTEKDSIENALVEAESEIMAAIDSNEENWTFYYVSADPSSWDHIDEETAYVRVNLGLSIEIPEDLSKILKSIDSDNEKYGISPGQLAIIESIFDKMGIHAEDYNFHEHEGNFSISAYMTDEDLGTPISVEYPSASSVVNAIEYWATESEGQKEQFLMLLKNSLIEQGYIESNQDSFAEELEEDLSSFTIEVEDDISEEDFNQITASARILDISKIDSTTYAKVRQIIISRQLFAKKFYEEIVDAFSPNLKQLILPNVSYGEVIPISAPAGATLSMSGANVYMNIFIKNEDNYDEMKNFLIAVDSRIEQVRELFTNLLRQEISE